MPKLDELALQCEEGDTLEFDGQEYTLGEQIGNGGVGVLNMLRSADGTEKVLKRYVSGITYDLYLGLVEGLKLRKEADPAISPDLFVYPEFISYGNVCVEAVVMNYVRGASLAAILPSEFDYHLLIKLLRKLVESVYDFIEAAINSGLVHGDFKIANTLIDAFNDVVAVVDLDTLKRAHYCASSMTQLWGTPELSPPEYVRCYASPTVDVFSISADLTYDLRGVADFAGLSAGGRYLQFWERKGGLFSTHPGDKRLALRQIRDYSRYPEHVREDIAGLLEFVIAGLNPAWSRRPKTKAEAVELLSFKPNISQV